jgi:hypothetical protein
MRRAFYDEGGLLPNASRAYPWLGCAGADFASSNCLPISAFLLEALIIPKWRVQF